MFWRIKYCSLVYLLFLCPLLKCTDVKPNIILKFPSEKMKYRWGWRRKGAFFAFLQGLPVTHCWLCKWGYLLIETVPQGRQTIAFPLTVHTSRKPFTMQYWEFFSDVQNVCVQICGREGAYRSKPFQVCSHCVLLRYKTWHSNWVHNFIQYA